MRHTFTEAQVRMFFHRAERQLHQIVANAIADNPAARHIARPSHAAFHETVVSLVTLFRDDMAGAAHVATRIAREYANGVDAKAGAPTLASAQAILAITRQAFADCFPAQESAAATTAAATATTTAASTANNG